LEVCWLDKKADERSLVNHAEPLFDLQDLVSVDPAISSRDDVLHSVNEPQDHDISYAAYELQDPNLITSESGIHVSIGAVMCHTRQSVGSRSATGYEHDI
jgi:hypothetical protein